MAEYTMPKYKPLTMEYCFREVGEISYKSPITLLNTICHDLQVHMEDNVMTAIRSYGIDVDKDELVKALRYDRDQYKQGYADACMDRMGRIRSEIATEIFEAVLDVYKDTCDADFEERFAELKKKYTEGE